LRDYLHPDYLPCLPSERQRIATLLAEWLRAEGLRRRGDGPVRRHPKGRCYEVPFAGGQVNVYGPDYLVVRYDTATPERPFAFETRVLGSAEEAMAFVGLAFRENDWEGALAVPSREPKRKKKAEEPVMTQPVYAVPRAEGPAGAYAARHVVNTLLEALAAVPDVIDGPLADDAAAFLKEAVAKLKGQGWRLEQGRPDRWGNRTLEVRPPEGPPPPADPQRLKPGDEP
jgi:hypothetical protein